MTEVNNEKTTTEVVEPQAVKLADSGAENATETGSTAATPTTAAEQSNVGAAEAEVGEAASPTVDAERKDEEWTNLQTQLQELNTKLESLSRKVSKLSTSSKASPSGSDENEVVEVGGLKVASPPAQIAKEKKALLRRRARAAKKLPRPKRRKVGQN